LSAESSDIYSRSIPPSNFEIGSRDLRDWLSIEGLDGVEVALAPSKPVPGTQGAELATGLLLILKSQAVAALANSIQTWFKVRKPKIKLTIKSGKKQFTLEAENTQIDKALVDNLSALIKEAG
jgi:hypothetical protein